MKKLLLLFFIATIANGVIFIFRDYFTYQPYSSYAELYAPCGDECKQKWDNFLLPYSGESIAEAKNLLAPLRLDTARPTNRMKLISEHLRQRFAKQTGYPTDIIHRSDPIDQYKILSADTSQKLWCGTWAQLVSFFGWSHGLVCRNVEIMKPGDRHVLNEYFVPELKMWAMVDLTHDILFAEKNGTILNTVDFLNALETPDSVTIFTGSNESILLSQFVQLPTIRSYYGKNFDFYYYHTTHSSIAYRPADKVKRYFLPDSWYEIYTAKPNSNVLFYVKLVFIVGWLILGSLILVKRFHDRSKRPTERI